LHVWILGDILRDVPGGMRRHMELHAEGLERLGHRATLLARDAFPLRTPVSISRRLPGLRSLMALLPRYRRERPDIINVHSLCAPAWVCARTLGLVDAKLVAMSYAAAETGLGVHTLRDGLRWALAAMPPRLTFRRLDGIWCVNNQDLDLYVDGYGVDRARVVLIPHAVDDLFYAPPVEQTPRRPRRLLFVGTWIERKGIDVLAAALAQVVAALPDVEVELCGTLSGEDAVRAALAPAVSARTNVVVQASSGELMRHYLSSTLLLVPSRVEGLPISMLEAMACGCPPLAAANSGMLDVIEPDRNGWIERTFDPQRWAARIIELLGRPADLEAASRGAKNTADAFRLDRVTREAVSWYQRLLPRTGSSDLAKGV
jgi:glycosyltransferase involved in cell wall biosynthesis